MTRRVIAIKHNYLSIFRVLRVLDFVKAITKSYLILSWDLFFNIQGTKQFKSQHRNIEHRVESEYRHLLCKQAKRVNLLYRFWEIKRSLLKVPNPSHKVHVVRIAAEGNSMPIKKLARKQNNCCIILQAVNYRGNNRTLMFS